MYVKNCWYVAAWDHELSDQSLITRTIMNQPIVIFRKSDGTLAALEDRCCHRAAPLSLGTREGDSLRCGYHGLRFDGTGKCIEVPGQTGVPEAARVRSFPAITLHSWIWVWMGDPSRADPALIPPVFGLDEGYMMRSGQMDYAANYLLVNDNLCDFSHVAFVHASSFRVREYADTFPTITELERGIRVSRWLHDPADRPDWVPAGDTWQTYDYLAPGVLGMYSALYPTGTADHCGGAPDGLPPLHANFSSQAITPMTDDTSRYFFAMGPRTSENAPELADLMLVSINQAFAEDKRVIEAQYKSIKAHGANTLMIRQDKGPVLMRRIMDRLRAGDAPAKPGAQ